MLSLNDREWNDFYIKHIFKTFKGIKGLQVPTGAYINKDELQEGKIPRVTVKDTNNGIDKFSFFHSKNFKTFSNFISVSFLGSVFYHPYTASLDMKVHCLQLKDREFNKYTVKFFLIALKSNLNNSNYGDQLSSTDLPNKKILLPVTTGNNPDYAFMEQYIKEREQQIIQNYITYIGNNIQNGRVMKMLSLNDREWKECKISDIFDIDLATGDTQADKCIDGLFPLVSSGFNNNGVCKFIGSWDKKSRKYNAGIITVDMFGKAFTQETDFFSVSHGRINLLKPKLETNNYIRKFLVTAINNSTTDKFSYNQMCSSKRLTSLKIMLPINEQGNPDYAFMEQYIKEREQQIIQNYVAYMGKRESNFPVECQKFPR